MDITCLTVGELKTNCYLAIDSSSKKTLIIDPGNEADFISTTILEKKLQPQAILFTHGHYDHCLGALELKLNFNIPIYLHQADLFLYKKAFESYLYWNSTLRGSTPTRQPTPLKLPPIDFFITDNQIINLGDSSLQVIHTPGHTPGSCCFLISPSVTSNLRSEICLFTGDTLFSIGIGSTEHKYSSKSDLQSSLKKISDICNLKSETLIYPGHEDFGQLLQI